MTKAASPLAQQRAYDDGTAKRGIGNPMTEIGGYFGLETFNGQGCHATCLGFNTARNAFGALLEVLGRKPYGFPARVFLPVFNCPDVAEFIQREFENIEIVFYNVNDGFEPILDLPFDADLDLLYVVDYFSLTANVIEKVAPGTVVDNVQAFFRSPRSDVHTLYSARKFFGVPDGGYLSTTVPVPVPDPAVSWDRAAHLLRRLDEGAQAAYGDFTQAEERLTNAPVRGMSNLSKAILATTDMERVAHTRLDNFRHLHAAVGDTNQLTAKIDDSLCDADFVPFTYPLLIEDGAQTRAMLIKKKIYVPMYWGGVADDPKATDFERHVARNTLHLPIDQRYGRSDMDLILQHLEPALEES